MFFRTSFMPERLPWPQRPPREPLQIRPSTALVPAASRRSFLIPTDRLPPRRSICSSSLSRARFWLLRITALSSPSWLRMSWLMTGVDNYRLRRLPALLNGAFTLIVMNLWRQPHNPLKSSRGQHLQMVLPQWDQSSQGYQALIQGGRLQLSPDRGYKVIREHTEPLPHSFLLLSQLWAHPHPLISRPAQSLLLSMPSRLWHITRPG